MYEDSVTISNEQQRSITVVVEPWARSIELDRGASLRIAARSPVEGRLEILQEELVTAVFAWEGATAQAWIGDDLVEDFDISVPEMPKGMSTPSFMRMLFGLGRSEVKVWKG